MLIRTVNANEEVIDTFSLWASDREKLSGVDPSAISSLVLREGVVEDVAISFAAVDGAPGDYRLLVTFPNIGYHDLEVSYTNNDGNHQAYRFTFDVQAAQLVMSSRAPG